ncbi:MAG: thiamine pyrophosphokinase [Bifidobacteriaceae bacterium]|jgi:uncharacterized membrane-anchored protein|nr:thiamine pyrophosphokinase [Bifidobacteriaceae bacterium]
MRLVTSRRRAKAPAKEVVVGIARVDRRTKHLTGRLKPGEIAVIDHAELDRVAAEALVAANPAAVLNAARSASDRFPNLGPEIIVNAGIPLLDHLGPGVLKLKQGVEVRVDPGRGEVRQSGRLVASGDVQTESSVTEAQQRARDGLREEIAAFAANTMEYLERESDQFLDRQDIPEIRTDMRDRVALIVVRGYHYREDLNVLRSFARERRPVIIGVDGGADAVLEAGLKPNLIVGDMDSVSDKALSSGAELVVHAYRDGRAPGAERLEKLGLEYTALPLAGTSEDVAMMIADDKGAELIVAVGTHMTLVEFLDKGRAGMASTFLTRLRVGSKLVDAKGVSRLYRKDVSNWQLTGLVTAGLVALWVALAATPSGQTLLGLTGAFFDDAWAWIRSLVGG